MSSHLIAVHSEEFYDATKAPSTAKNQPSPSNAKREATITTTNPPVNSEIITENKSRYLAPWQAKILNNFLDDHSHKPTKYQIRQLSLLTQRTEKSVKKWFYQQTAELNKKNNTAKKRLTQNQLETLESYFENDQKPKGNKLENLSDATGLSVIQIYIWFQQKRRKTKKELQKNNNNQIFTNEKKRGKKLTKFTVVEKALLKSEYENCPKPTYEEKERLSDKYG